MNILEEIMAHKKKEVENIRNITPVKSLEKGMFYNTPTKSLQTALKSNPDGFGIIAEFKRKSPSKGIINRNADVRHVTRGYVDAGAAALSVLTDNKYFCGMLDDLYTAKRYNSCPVLRKDFICCEYQLIEAKAFGADAILLIAAVLDKKTIKKLSELAHQTGLEVLMEVHDKEEIDKANQYIDIIGVNNRDLKSFNVDIKRSLELAEHITGDQVKISESGINDPRNIAKLRKAGFKGFLIGEYFMKHPDPASICGELIKNTKAL